MHALMPANSTRLALVVGALAALLTTMALLLVGAPLADAHSTELAPPAQRGPELPRLPLSFEERLATARVAPPDDSRLDDYFFGYTRGLAR